MAKRVPRNYDGAAPTGREIRDLLPGIVSGISLKLKDEPQRVVEVWPEIVGAKISKMSRAVSFSGGVLRVLVSHSTLNSLLTELEKPRLLAALRKRFPDLVIRDITFKIG